MYSIFFYETSQGVHTPIRLVTCYLAVILKMSLVHAKVDKVVLRGIKAFASIAAGSGYRLHSRLAAEDPRIVMDAIAANPDTSRKAKDAARAALEKLS